jgi:hypothetical protein
VHTEVTDTATVLHHTSAEVSVIEKSVMHSLHYVHKMHNEEIMSVCLSSAACLTSKFGIGGAYTKSIHTNLIRFIPVNKSKVK